MFNWIKDFVDFFIIIFSKSRPWSEAEAKDLITYIPIDEIEEDE